MADNPYRHGKREFQEDFSPGPFPNISIVRRPGALSLDYLTCFTLGPKALADVSDGPVARAWQIRYDPALLSFYASSANDSNTDWLPEVFLFTHDGVPFDEIDAAFDQQAHIVIAGQRANHVWIYFFDGLLGAFSFQDFGAGRTPKILLDNPLDVSNSDVLVFYIDDAANKIRFVQQRDRYLVVYDTPATNTGASYIEDAIRSKDYRIHVYYSTRHDTTGQYTLDHIETTLFPVPIVAEDFLTAAVSMLDGGGTGLHKILLVLSDDLISFPEADGPTQGKDDALTASIDFGAGNNFHEPLILHVLYDPEQLTASVDFGPGGTIVVVGPNIITHTLFDPEQLTASAEIGTGGTLRVSLIQHTLFDTQDMTAAASIGTGGTLV